MRNVRRFSQGIFLLIFLFLFIQTESKGMDELGYPVKIFLDFDPLILTTTILSAHAAAKAFYLSVITIIVTLVFGRVFCGWICPLGTLNNIVGAMRKGRPKTDERNWYRVKYYVLIFLIISSLFSLQLVGIVDPLSLLIRSFSVSVYPLFSYGTRAIFDAVYSTDIKGITAVSEFVYSGLKKSVLSFQQPFYNQSLFIGALFFLILGLNLVEKRFWCRYLCPLGAMLGLLSKFSILKRSVSEGCTSCGACANVCQGNASPDKKEEWRDTECYYCWNCDDICPQNAVSFGFSGKKNAAAMDLGRRRVITSMASGMIAVPLLRATPISKTEFINQRLIRPPGSLEEKEFLKRCVKCGECMKVCITNGLQPTLLEAGIEGIWSPLLIPKLGYCEFRCTLCGQVCPTGAIKKLKLEEKAKVKIGLAMIDKNRCLPYAHARPCIVCEEVCPTPKKAIWFEKAKVKDRNGKEFIVQQPRVDLELCIGCGICEAKCPVVDRPAIYVTSIGESRSKENKLLMEGY
ncbi:MAG: 4Fe-4S binding protein [Nitrospirae bacterium]|nr:4Fe-4S binding protein [Nitrospirota bacterium]MCL5978894.1 4Fe-4S binding protein [Nitrospirota bacterium]